jgi:hypothetical protein
MPQDPLDEPLTVVVTEGEVVVLGPDGFSGSFTPQAARETGRRLIAAAETAADAPAAET